MRGRRVREPGLSLADEFQGLRNDYDAAKSSRYRRLRTGVSSSGSGADYHYRSESDYLRMLEQARDMDRNDVVIGQTIDRAIMNVVQDGFTLDPQTGNANADNVLWKLWDEFATDPEQCDVAGELTFNEMEMLIPRQAMVDGDCLALPLREGPIEIVEAHRLRTPSNTKQNVVHGILLDAQRRRLQYWLTKDDIDPSRALTKVGDIKPYDARDKDGNRNVLHIYNPKRVSQTRGVSALAPVFNPAGMFEDINFAKMVQQQTVSCFAIFREMAAGRPGGGLPSVDDPATGASYDETQSDGTTRRITGIAPGMDIRGRPGEKLTGFSPNVPNAEFFDHVRLMLTLIGINLGMPLVLVLMDAKETNFSGYRGALDEARRGFRRNQKWLMRRFHGPIYRWKLRQWIATNPEVRALAEKLGPMVFAHRWNVPAWPYIEPNKDAQGDALQLEKLLNSPRRKAAERGFDFQTMTTEQVEDNGYRIRAAIKEAQAIEVEFGVAVDWHECLALTGAAAKLEKSAPKPTEPDKQEEPPADEQTEESEQDGNEDDDTEDEDADE